MKKVVLLIAAMTLLGCNSKAQDSKTKTKGTKLLRSIKQIPSGSRS